MLDDQTAHFLPEYEKQIAKLAIRYGQTTKALSKGTFDIISGSFEAADAMEFLEVATRSAIGGFTDVATSVKAMVAILNAYGMSAGEAGRVTDVMSSIVKKGVIEYEELASTIGQVVPIAAAAGLSLEELAAGIATITQKGVSAHMTMTALKAIITTFLAPTPEAVKQAEKFGLVLDSTTLSTIGLTGALGKLEHATSEETAAIFSNVRALLGVEATRKTITKLIENHETALNSLGLSEINYQKAADTTNVVLAQNRELWVSIKREIGEGIEGPVNEFLVGLNRLVSEWQDGWNTMLSHQRRVKELMAREMGDSAWLKLIPFIKLTDLALARLTRTERDFLEKMLEVREDTLKFKDALAELEIGLDKIAKRQAKGRAQIDRGKKPHWSVLEKELDIRIGLTDAQKKAGLAITKLSRELQVEKGLIGLTNDERERSIKLVEFEVYAKTLLGDSSGELVKIYKEELISMQKLREQAEDDEAFARKFEEDRRNILRGPLIAMLEDRELEEVFKEGLARLGTTIVEHMYEKTIVDPLMQALEDTIDPAMEKIADKMMDHLSELAGNVADLLSDVFGGIINVVGGAISGGIGGLFGGAATGATLGTGAGSITGSGISGITLPMANGAVFNNASVTPFSRGGILDGPTIFPMANGGLALGGEAGHEALMPLKRDSSGRLGVTTTDDANSSQTPIKIINVLDDSMFNEYLSTGDGERQIVNIMRRNAGEVANIST